MRKYIPYILILIILTGLFGFVSRSSAQNPNDPCRYDNSGPLPRVLNFPCAATINPSVPIIITPTPGAETGTCVDLAGVPSQATRVLCPPPNSWSTNKYTPTQKKDYTLLVPLPGVTSEADCVIKCETNLEKYLPNAFKLAIGIAAVLAFVMITFGGITYAVADSITGKESGKTYIENALWGLLLVIGAYTILYTINPQLVQLQLEIKRPEIKSATSSVAPRAPMNQAQIDADKLVRDSLPSNIATKSPCLAGQTTNCVNLNGLPIRARTGLGSLASNGCRCSLFISGGTEDGHASHEVNAPIVDLRPNLNLNNYITGNANSPRDGTTVAKTLPNGQRATFTYEVAGGNARGTSSGDHWHVVIE